MRGERLERKCGYMRYSVLKHTVGKVASLDMRRYARNVPMTQVRLHHINGGVGLEIARGEWENSLKYGRVFRS